GLFDPFPVASEGLAKRLAQHYPDLEVTTGSADPAGYDLVVNATPIGMKEGDPMPMDVDRIAPGTFVGDVVMKQEITPFLAAAEPPRSRAAPESPVPGADQDPCGALAQGLAAAGSALERIATLVVTHAHIDHFGLAGEVVRRSGGELLMHQASRLDTDKYAD